MQMKAKTLLAILSFFSLFISILVLASTVALNVLEYSQLKKVN